MQYVLYTEVSCIISIIIFTIVFQICMSSGYRQNIWKVFTDFKKAYDSIYRDSLYNAMYEFGFPKNLISLPKMYINRTRYQVRAECTVPEKFEVMTGLKQSDTLSPILFNISIRKSDTQYTKQ